MDFMLGVLVHNCDNASELTCFMDITQNRQKLNTLSYCERKYEY